MTYKQRKPESEFYEKLALDLLIKQDPTVRMTNDDENKIEHKDIIGKFSYDVKGIKYRYYPDIRVVSYLEWRNGSGLDNVGWLHGHADKIIMFYANSMRIYPRVGLKQYVIDTIPITEPHKKSDYMKWYQREYKKGELSTYVFPWDIEHLCEQVFKTNKHYHKLKC